MSQEASTDPDGEPVDFAVDDTGLRVPLEAVGTWQVAFDGRVVLSLTPEPDLRAGAGTAPWVGATVSYLDGVSHVTLHQDDDTVDLGEVRFGSGEGRVAFADGEGRPVVIDKWGLAQQPFATRGEGVPQFLAEKAAELCEIAREECGIDLWIAFGTLLGAARSGHVIPHDSDIDLAYLSEHQTPYRIQVEVAGLRRALSARRLLVVNKTGSFLTVKYTAPDGQMVSIDIYACFHFHDLLYETASARAPVPREAVLPLRTMEFEGLQLPAPADPHALLEVSYGPGWRHPDPSFEHRPDEQIRSRFDGWFGNAMRRRRDWELRWSVPRRPFRGSDFSGWVRSRVPEGTVVVEFGIGQGGDAVAYAASGRPVAGLDYARQAGRAVMWHRSEYDKDQLEWWVTNLYDLRDALSWGALVARRPHDERVLVARGLLEAMRPEERDYFWSTARMLGRRSRGLLLEIDEFSGAGREGTDATYRFPVDREQVHRAAGRVGGRVVETILVGTEESAVEGGTRWRMVVDWPRRPATEQAQGRSLT